MKRPPFDPKRARGDSFDAGLFDPTPVARPSTPLPSRQSSLQEEAARETPAPREIAPAAEPAFERDAVAPSARPADPLTVSQFSTRITRALEDGLRGVHRIEGEIANLSKRNHWYFSIKDEKAVLACVIWQSDAVRVGFDPREGEKVVVTGKIGHYAPQGRTQFYATKLERSGVGDLELRFQQLLKELRELGYFEPGRKKRLPPLPLRVAVVTSAGGAALQDVLQTARERCPAVEFIVVDVRVQGEGAAGEVARALRALDRRRVELGVDAVIVTRGGGSREDLWAFNERVVADAVYGMHLPVVAAIGHEVDTTIVELVADLRASTPTQAVMMLLPDLEALAERRERLADDLARAMRWSFQARRERLAGLAGELERLRPEARLAQARGELAARSARLVRSVEGRLAARRRGLEALAERLARAAPSQRAAVARATLTALTPRFARAMAQRFARERAELSGLERRLRSAGPEETLQRGYAIVTDARGALVRAAAVRPGDAIAVRVADGTLGARVESAHPEGHSGPE